MNQLRKSFAQNLRSGPRVIRDVCADTLRRIQNAQLLMVASSLAYTTILSIIPVLAVSFAVFQSFGGLEKVYDGIEPLILSYLTEGNSADVIHIIKDLIRNTHAGAIGVGGLIGLIFTSISMLSSAEKAINRAWELRVTRKFLYRVAVYWLFISLGPIALSVGVGLATSAQLPLTSILPSGTGSFLIETILFFVVYHWVPQTQVVWTCSLTAATLTAGFWNLARLGYSYAASHILTYNKVYGSLAAVPIILLWIYILWVITLSGAALTVALQKRTGRS